MIGIGGFGRKPSPNNPVIQCDKVPAGFSFLISPLTSQIIEGTDHLGEQLVEEALFLDEKVSLNEFCFQLFLSFLETTTMSD